MSFSSTASSETGLCVSPTSVSAVERLFIVLGISYTAIDCQPKPRVTTPDRRKGRVAIIKRFEQYARYMAHKSLATKEDNEGQRKTVVP